MVKKLILIMVLLCAVSVHAQISPTLDSLRLYVSGRAELPFAGTNDIDTADMIREILMGIRQTCLDFPALEKFDTITVDSASEGGALPADFRMVKEAYLSAGDYLRMPLQFLEGDSLFSKLPTQDAATADLDDSVSVRYYHIHGTQLILHPKWYRGDDATVLLEYYAIDTTHMIAGDSVTLVRLKYREKIIEYAVSRLWAMRGNVAMAEYWMREYEKGLVKDVD